jgi:Ser/Thr protein kinase RdoA (MazF antagonist)
MVEEEREFDLLDIASNFRLAGRVRSVFPFGSGHINDTYKVLTGEKSYLLQRVNQQVFMDVRGLTSNLIRVTNYLGDLIEDNPKGKQVLNTIRTLNGTYFFIDDDANFWRMFDFVEGSISYDRTEDSDLATEGGTAFGWFIRSLNNFPISTLVHTIPDFHNAEYRLANFKKAVEQNRAGRLEEAATDVELAMKRAEEMLTIHRLGDEGKFPVRVTHNDTKINNVLFDNQKKWMCVIDLDTVMPGFVHFDFGDAIRTFTNAGSEDEKDLDKIYMKIDLFRAFSEGFLSEAKDVLTEEEIKYLAFSAKYIVWEQTIRFLTDFLNGDRYYKIKYPEHNLVRTRAQAKLLQSMEEQFGEMEAIIKSLV